MRRFLMILACIALLLPACNNAQKEVEALDKQTMDIHDEAMKEMAEMNRTSRALKEFLKTARLTEEKMAVYTEVLGNIEKAESGMMEWMTQYKSPEGKSPEEAMPYLQDQKAKITKSRDDIHAATEAGKKLLQN